MKTDIQDALSSVTEVAIFAWTLIELLFTRILPLVGYLAGYLLLQFGTLLSSVVVPAVSRPRRKLQGEYSWDHVSQAEERVEEEENVQVVKEDEDSWDTSQAEELVEKEEMVQVVKKEDDDQQNISESLKSTHAEPEKSSQRISREEASKLPSLEEEDEEAEAAGTVAEAALPKSAPPDRRLVTDSHDPSNEKQARGINQEHVAESSQPVGQRIDLPPSDTSEKHADEANKQFKLDVAGVEEGHVSLKAESGAGKMDLEPSDTQPSKEAATSGSSGEMRKMSGEWGGAEVRKSSNGRGSSRILHVLPPSLSQVKRTLRQRSRRVTFFHAEEAE